MTDVSKQNASLLVRGSVVKVRRLCGKSTCRCAQGELHGPERIAHLAFLLYSLVWLWYLQTQGTKRTWKILPWYPQKRTASFTDALASLRKMMWRKRIITTTGKTSVPSKILTTLIDVVAAAA